MWCDKLNVNSFVKKFACYLLIVCGWWWLCCCCLLLVVTACVATDVVYSYCWYLIWWCYCCLCTGINVYSTYLDTLRMFRTTKFHEQRFSAAAAAVVVVVAATLTDITCKWFQRVCVRLFDCVWTVRVHTCDCWFNVTLSSARFCLARSKFLVYTGSSMPSDTRFFHILCAKKRIKNLLLHIPPLIPTNY